MPKELSHLWLPYTQMKTTLAPIKAIRTKGSIIYLDNQESIQKFITEHPEKRSMPQIWIDNEHIGGYEQLKTKLL